MASTCTFLPPPPELTTEVHHNEIHISGHDQHEQTLQLSTTVHCKRDGEGRGVEILLEQVEHSLMCVNSEGEEGREGGSEGQREGERDGE